MELSRRDALRAGGGLLAAGLAGCIEQRVTRRETSVEVDTTWTLTPTVGGNLSRTAFDDYVDRMADRYGDSGVWGIESEQPDEFETAYVQRLAASRETPGQPGGSESSLDPGVVDPDAPLLFADACVAVYSIGDDRYRYWLWVAADGNDDRLVRDVDVSILSGSLSFRDGTVADTAQASQSDGEATVSLSGPPSGRFPLNETTRSIDTNNERGDNGSYFVDWNGSVDGIQSINGVCEEQRSGDYDFFWNIAAGYSFDEQV
jgi:hypothetical protein